MPKSFQSDVLGQAGGGHAKRCRQSVGPVCSLVLTERVPNQAGEVCWTDWPPGGVDRRGQTRPVCLIGSVSGSGQPSSTSWRLYESSSLFGGDQRGVAEDDDAGRIDLIGEWVLEAHRDRWTECRFDRRRLPARGVVSRLESGIRVGGVAGGGVRCFMAAFGEFVARKRRFDRDFVRERTIRATRTWRRARRRPTRSRPERFVVALIAVWGVEDLKDLGIGDLAQFPVEPDAFGEWGEVLSARRRIATSESPRFARATSNVGWRSKRIRRSEQIVAVRRRASTRARAIARRRGHGHRSP